MSFDTTLEPTKYCKKHNQKYHEYLDKCPICVGETAIGKNGKLKFMRYAKITNESKEQIKVIQWAKRQRENYPEIRWLHHIPNGGLRNEIVASKLKLEGVESGVFDLFLPVPRWNKNGLYIEMKYEKNKLSEKQKEFRQFVISQNYATAVCYSAEEGIKILKKYLGI